MFLNYLNSCQNTNEKAVIIGYVLIGLAVAFYVLMLFMTSD